MTQFLLIASDRPYTECPDVEFSRAREEWFSNEAAVAIFPVERKPVWSVSPPGREVGDLIYEVRDAVRAGEAIEGTALGFLLSHAMGKQDSFALFYGSDFEDLPIAASPQSLFKTIDEQLRVEDGSNLELYVRWQPDV